MIAANTRPLFDRYAKARLFDVARQPSRRPAAGERRNRWDLSALRRADAGDCGALGELLARSILDNLYRFVVPAVAGPARLVPLAALASEAIGAPALRTAANRGRLQAVRGADGEWRSSRNWVDEYLASRYKRG